MLELAGAPALAIHAGEVTQLDAAGAQLLYALFADCTRRGAPITWASASVYLVEAARMLGMEHCLGLTGLPAEVTSWQP
jgi:anti-anti-sigma regulatory factor